MRSACPVVVLLLTLLAGGCDGPELALPDPPPPPRTTRLEPQDGLPVHPQPTCSRAILKTLYTSDWTVLARLVAGGDTVRCRVPPDSSPLEQAILKDDVVGVRTVLQAGADPNLRSGSHGDRLPLRAAIDSFVPPRPRPNQAAMVRVLLEHGADPNARWCWSETRQGLWGPQGPVGPRACHSAVGPTPLTTATSNDRADLIALLFEGGADVTAEDWTGSSSLDIATGRAVFELLLAAQFPDPTTRKARALDYLNSRYPASMVRGPWEETPVGRALMMAIGGPGRLALLFELGADPNQRLNWGGVDWPPLALALNRLDRVAMAEALLASGADPNVRWCVPVPVQRPADGYRPEAGCQQERGITPLMVAAQLEDAEAVATLVRQRADTSLTDWKGRMALDYAPPNRRDDVRSALQGR